MTKSKEEVRTLELDPNPKGKLKMLGGSRSDDWNMRLLNLVGNALPIDHSNRELGNEATKAVCQATAPASRLASRSRGRRGSIAGALRSFDEG